MNCSYYVYGCFLDGFTQFPENSKEQLFRKVAQLAIHKSQIVTHRDGNLMYYNYIRKLSGDKQNHAEYFGMCILINGVILDDFHQLFSIFESVFEKAAYSNEIIGIDDAGNILPMCLSLDTNKTAIQKICEILHSHIREMETHCIALPPIAFEMSNTSVHSCSYTLSNSQIISQTARYPYVVVEKDKSYNSPGLTNYLQRLQVLYGHEAKKTQLNKRLIFWLFFALSVFCIFFLVLAKQFVKQ